MDDVERRTGGSTGQRLVRYKREQQQRDIHKFFAEEAELDVEMAFH